MNLEILKSNDNGQENFKEKIIEDTLSEYAAGDNELYPSWLASTRAVKARAEWHLLNAFEKKEDLSKYQLRNSPDHTGGLSVNFSEIIKDFWVPSPIKTDGGWWAKRKRQFDVFDQDEMNAFIYFTEMPTSQKLMIKRVLYCHNEETKRWDDKMLLFANDPVWRGGAKEYSVLLLENLLKSRMEISSTKQETNAKCIELITNKYLDEIKKPAE